MQISGFLLRSRMNILIVNNYNNYFKIKAVQIRLLCFLHVLQQAN